MKLDTLENLGADIGDVVIYVNPVNDVETEYSITEYKCLTFYDGYVLDYYDNWITNPNFNLKEKNNES